MKLFHNKLISKLLAIILGLACALYFGWTFSFFGFWMGEKFHGAVPGGSTVIALACWIVMSLAVIYTFFYAEYTKEDVQAYEDDRGDGSFERALKQLKWGILGLELFSLLFRWFQLNFALIGIAMIGIGLVLLYLAHLFGKILHAQANAPFDVEASRVMREAGSKAWQETRKGLRKVKGVDDLRRIASGDLSPIDKVKDASVQERQGEETRSAQRRGDDQARREKNRDVASRHLRPRDTDDVVKLSDPFSGAQVTYEANPLGQNGRNGNR
jgi:hypothetical protein